MNDEDLHTRISQSFESQGLMRHLGARLVRIAPGEVDIAMPFRDELSQQHGFFHAGGTSSIGDSAGGYAALSLAPRDRTVLTVEFKINLLAPALGETLLARGRVAKAGRTLTVANFKVFCQRDGSETLVAVGQQTLMLIPKRDGLAQD